MGDAEIAPETDANSTVLSVFARFDDEISHCAVRLSALAERCRTDEGAFYLNHEMPEAISLSGTGGIIFLTGTRRCTPLWNATRG